MNISIQPPVSFSQLGKRSNNEDSIFPLQGEADNTTKVFLVCDGVGGSNKGEVASQLVSQAVASIINEAPSFSDHIITQSVEFAFLKLQEHLNDNSDAVGMATTLTCLWLHAEGATMAHLGDSRIYHIRNGNILHKTADHSLIGEMIAQGLITEEQAKTHAKKNVITKAVMAGEPFETPTIYTTTDIQPGDLFFLCTDGVIESVSDSLLTTTLSSRSSLQEKLDILQEQCRQFSSDNNSAYLVEVAS